MWNSFQDPQINKIGFTVRGIYEFIDVAVCLRTICLKLLKLYHLKMLFASVFVHKSTKTLHKNKNKFP